MNYFSTLLILFIALFLFSCQKKDDPAFDENKLKVSIAKPSEAQIFRKGDTIFIAASADYLTQLHGYSLNITDTLSKEIYFDLDEHIHDSKFEINTFWLDTLDKETILRLQLTVEADHNGNEKTKEVIFKTAH